MRLAADVNVRASSSRVFTTSGRHNFAPVWDAREEVDMRALSTARVARHRRASSPTRLVPLVALALVSALTRSAAAVYVRFDGVLSSSDAEKASKEIGKFAFRVGGTLLVETTRTMNANGTWVLLCPRKELSIPASFAGLTLSMCQQTISDDYVATRGCVASLVPVEGSSLTLVAQRRAVHRVALALCGQNAQSSVEAMFVMTNPGGDHVGYDYAPSADAFMGFTVIWSFVFTVVGVALWRLREKCTWIHILVLAHLVTRIAWVAVAHSFWKNALKTGEGLPLAERNFHSPTGSSSSTGAYITILALNQSNFYTLWLVASYGWLITRRWLSASEVFTLGTFFLGILAANVACRSYAAAYMFVLFYLAYPSVFALTLGNCTRNLKSLRLQQLMLTHGSTQRDGVIVDAKEMIFRRLQGMVFWYIATKITCSLVELFLEDRMWLRYVLGEAVDFVTALWIMFTLLPHREANPFNTHFIRDWEAMFEGTVNSIADRIAALGLNTSEIPRPEFYVAYVGRQSETDDVVVNIADESPNDGVGCFHLILVEHPSCEPSFQNLSIAVPVREDNRNDRGSRHH